VNASARCRWWRRESLGSRPGHWMGLEAAMYLCLARLLPIARTEEVAMSVESQLAALSPEAMEEAVDIGEQFNSNEVLDQVVASLAEYDRTGTD